SNNCIISVKKRSSQDEGNFVVFFHFENNEISKKGEFTTSTSIFSAIPTGYWNDLSANLTLILVGLRVSRDSFAYKEYGIRLMLALGSAKALQEKVLLKLHGIRKLPGSLSFGGTLFWIITELSSLRKAKFVQFYVVWWIIGFTTSYEYDIHMLITSLRWLVSFRVATSWVWLSVAWKRSRRSPRLLDSESIELSFEVLD
ncbi:hypothetical protein Tco_1424855, partial [Tanacetum coccineum]